MREDSPVLVSSDASGPFTEGSFDQVWLWFDVLPFRFCVALVDVDDVSISDFWLFRFLHG